VILGAILRRANQAGTKSRSSPRPNLTRRVARTINRRIHRQNRQSFIPVDRERLAKPAAYGNDRVFAYLRPGFEAQQGQDAAVAALEKAGTRVRIRSRIFNNLGQEFFRWEIATALQAPSSA